MKWRRLLLAVAVLALAACKSPTAPRLPTPEDDGHKLPPDKPGFVMPGQPAG